MGRIKFSKEIKSQDYKKHYSGLGKMIKCFSDINGLRSLAEFRENRS